MTLRVVTPPSGGLISLADAKAHLRVDYADADDLISAYVLSASAMVEAETQRRFLTQTLEWVRADWCDEMPLPIAGTTDKPDALAITSVKYADLQGQQQTLDTGMYWDRPEGSTRAVVRQWFAVWPWLGDAAERVVITIDVTGEPADVPPMAVAATKLLVGHFWLHREAVVGVDARDSSTVIPLGVEQLLSPLRWS